MSIVRFLGAAILGGAAYPVIEIIYRGRTHPSMALAGAVCLPMIRLCARLPFNRNTRAAFAAIGVLLCEGGIGMMVNRDHRIWDYRKNKGNIGGQVCPQFALLWYLLCWGLVFRPRKNLLQK